MSTTTAAAMGREPELDRSVARIGAIGGVALLLASTVVVLYDLLLLVGAGRGVLWVTLAALVAGTVAARAIEERIALALAAGGAAAASVVYVLASPFAPGSLVDAVSLLALDAGRLLTGLTLGAVIDVALWVQLFLPIPVFLAWYLVLRRHYLASVVVAAVALAVPVLTGDALIVHTTAGAIGALFAVGLGRLDLRGGSLRQGEALVVVVLLIALLALAVPFVPAAADGDAGVGSGTVDGITGLADDDRDLASDVEGSYVDSGDELRIQGGLELDEEVRFTVVSEEPGYWRTDVYDRYTGDGWVKTGDASPYDGELEGPPGETETVTQYYAVESRTTAMPGMTAPVEIEGDAAAYAEVDDHGTLRSTAVFDEGDRFNVRSERVVDDPDRLAAADGEVPAELQERYTQVPDSTPDRVGDYTDELVGTADVDGEYETALLLEAHLRDHNEYSLDIERPDGDIADQFLFEMDEGYCTYYATTMVTMLRTQDIPARLATGYNTGQEVDDNTYVVRALDAHAWVEVYVAGEGWVTFDPTPAADWSEVREDRIGEAREEGIDAVDTEESADQPLTEPDDEQGIDEGNETETNATETETNATDRDLSDQFGAGTDEFEDVLDPQDPQWQQEQAAGDDDPITTLTETLGNAESLAVGVLLVLGASVGLRRTGATARARTELTLHWQRRGSPQADVERAADRVELLLAERYAPRRPTETRREYLARLPGVDDRARRVFELRERVVHGGADPGAVADEAVSLADELVDERGLLAGVRR